MSQERRKRDTPARETGTPRPAPTKDEILAVESELLEAGTPELQQPASPLGESRSFSYLGLRIAQYALLFVATIIITRRLGPVGRAQYALPLALSGGVWVLTHLTLELATSRMLARKEQTLDQVVPALALATLVLSAVGVGISVVIGITQSSSFLAGATDEMVILASLTIPFLLASQMAGQILVFLGLLRAHGLASAAGAVVQLAVVLALLVADSITPTSALAATLAGFAATGIALVVMVGRETRPGLLLPRARASVLRPLVRTGATLHPASVAIQLTPRLDLILVAVLLSAEAAGLFSLALVLADSMLLVAQALSMSAISRQLGHAQDDAERFTLEFARQSFLLGLAAVLAVSLLAYPFVVLVYGDQFAGSVLPFIILMFALVATTIEGPCRVLLIRVASPWLVSSLVCAAMVINVAATAVLVQVLSITGAALAALIGYWFLAIMALRLVRERADHATTRIFSLPNGDDELIRIVRQLVRRSPDAAAR